MTGSHYDRLTLLVLRVIQGCEQRQVSECQAKADKGQGPGLKFRG